MPVKKMERFILELTSLGFNPDDVAKWKCVGCGEVPEGMNPDYIRQKMWEEWSQSNKWRYDVPDKKEQCLCGHSIRYNYYITSNDKYEGRDILVVGSCCMRDFLEDGMRKHCDNCRVVHKRTKYDICVDCEKEEKKRIREIKKEQKKITCECGKTKRKEYKLCYTCRFPPNIDKSGKKKCQCGKFIAHNFSRCYSCNKGHY